MNIIYVFIGSGVGGTLRWLLSTYLNGHYPVGTFVVNILGCFLIGLLSKMFPGDAYTKLLLVTGFCGGFTTFSTFVNENFLMMRAGQFMLALVYIAVSVVVGILAAYLGYKIG